MFGLVCHSAATLIDFEQVWSQHMYDIASNFYNSLISEHKPASVLAQTKETVQKISGGWTSPTPRRQTISKENRDLKKRLMTGVLYKEESMFLQSLTFLEYTDSKV